MVPIFVVLLFALGLVLIVRGGDDFVDAAAWMADASGVPEFLIGATIVSVGTTLPELLVSLMAAEGGAMGIAAGNAVGSVTANLGLILGISVLCAAGTLDRHTQGFKLIMMGAAIGLLTAFTRRGSLSIPCAVILLALLPVCLAESLIGLHGEKNAPRPGVDAHAVAANIVKFLAGGAGILIGARLLVDCGANLALLCGVPEGIIGATLVAVGTSLPELVTAVAALARGQAGLTVGNIVGANIIDLTLILPLCCLTSGRPLPLPPQSVALDIPFCLALTLLAILPPLVTGRFRRRQGLAMLGLYGVYVAALCHGMA